MTKKPRMYNGEKIVSSIENDRKAITKKDKRGTCVTQSIKRPTLGFSSGHDLMVCGFEPDIGLCTDNTEPAWDSPSFSASPPLTHVCTLSLSK